MFGFSVDTLPSQSDRTLDSHVVVSARSCAGGRAHPGAECPEQRIAWPRTLRDMLLRD